MRTMVLKTSTKSTIDFTDAQAVYAADIDGDGAMDVLGGSDGELAWFESSLVAAPTISSVSLNAANSELTVTFAEDVYNTNGGSGDLEVADFALSISGGAAGVNATPASITKTTQNIWVLGLTLTGGTADGGETLTVVPAAGTAIYNAAGNAASTSQSNNTASLTEKIAPTITNLAIYDTDFNGLIDKIIVTFSENVDTDDGSAPVAGDFGTIILPDGQTADLTGASFTDPAGSSNTVTITGITGQLTDNTAVGATAIDGITNQWKDGAANATSNPDDAETITDVAAPQVSDLAIYDTDFNGLIDKIIVTFSENVDTDDGSAPVAGDFGTIVLPDGQNATLGGAFTDPAGSSSTVTITGITGQLTDNTNVGATAVDGITNQWKDGAANATSNPDEFETITDAVAPQVSDLAIYDTDFNGLIDKIIVTFSENVDTDDGSAPVAGDFGTIILPDGQNANLGGASFTDPAGSSSTVTITGITGQLTDNTAVGATAIDGITNQWTDGTTLTSNPDDAETITDVAAPQVSDLAIYDTDFNGLIDKIIVTFSENVDTDDGSAPVAGDFGTIVLPDGQNATLGGAFTDPAGSSSTVTITGITGQLTDNTNCRSYCCRWNYQSVEGWRCQCNF